MSPYDLLTQTSPASFDRKLWTQPSPVPAPDWAAIFLDAELYIERVQAPVVIDRLQRERIIPPMAAVYVSNNGAAARHVDYACHADYAKFVVNDVVPWVKTQHPSVEATKMLLIGLSLSGLAAADIARRYPEVFRAVICQSPSFWWERERFPTTIPPKPAMAPDYWICVGDQETERGVTHAPSGLRQDSNQIEACEHTRDAFRQLGYRVAYRTYEGGHDPRCWQADLELALPWACSDP